MAALSKDSMRRALAALDALLGTHAQLLFSRNRWVGLLVLAAAASVPRSLLLGLTALLGATAAVRALGLSNATTYVPYGYNALLVGYAIAHDYALDAISISWALAIGVVSTFVTAALSSLAGYLGWVPVLSVPFIVSSWFALGMAPHLSLSGAPPFEPPGLVAFAGWRAWVVPPPLLAQLLEDLGGCVFIPSTAAGTCILVALLLHSRIASMLAVGAALSVLALLELTHAPVSESLSQLIGANAVLAAIALGGVWLIPSRGSFLLALLGVVLAAFFALGFARPLQRLGLSLSFVPWNAAVILMLSALRQRASNHGGLRLAGFAAESPEQLLLAHITQAGHASEPGGVAFRVPFLGVWTCTQGVDGAFTHQGALRHAFDFEVYGDLDGSLCTGEGQRAEEYRCFGLPVLAAADGTVVATEYEVPNNPIGEVTCDKPWGNHVTLQHGAGLYSVVAHLAPHTVAVYVGQFVRRGALLGYLGNSGRSPRPHLHFQLQSALRLGSPTLPCRFVDSVVRTGNQTRFESSHVPREGEAVRALEPNHALATYFDLPQGVQLTYRIGTQLERLESGLDGWGRPVLRSVERRGELVLARSDTGFSCAELRGPGQAVLGWLRLCLSCVPYDRELDLQFRSLVPQRWLGGWLRGVYWDFVAAFKRIPGLELNFRLELEADRLTLSGKSLEHNRRGAPRVATRAVLERGVGPTLIEVTVDGRMQRAELLSAGLRDVFTTPGALAPVQPALGLGDCS